MESSVCGITASNGSTTTRRFPRPPSVTSCRWQFLDRLIGRLVEHLKQVGLYDDTLIVITADHGVSFRAGDLRREVTPTNHADILSIPLVIKVPHQRRGLDQRPQRAIGRHRAHDCRPAGGRRALAAGRGFRTG